MSTMSRRNLLPPHAAKTGPSRLQPPHRAQLGPTRSIDPFAATERSPIQRMEGDPSRGAGRPLRPLPVPPKGKPGPAEKEARRENEQVARPIDAPTPSRFPGWSSNQTLWDYLTPFVSELYRTWPLPRRKSEATPKDDLGVAAARVQEALATRRDIGATAAKPAPEDALAVARDAFDTACKKREIKVRFTFRGYDKAILRDWHYYIMGLALEFAPPTLFPCRESLSTVVAFEAKNIGGFSGNEGSFYVPGERKQYFYPVILAAPPLALLRICVHEFGHALLEPYLRRERMNLWGKFEKAWAIFKERGGFYCVNLDVCGDLEFRKTYQNDHLTEFVADTYMAYFLHHVQLREHIDSQRGTVQQAWAEVWDALQEVFGAS